MVARQRRSAEYWKEIIGDFLKSGKSQKDYLREHKISRATLSAWSRRLGIPLSHRRRHPKVEKEPPPLVSFVDIELLGRPKASPSLKIEISFPQGHTLKLETEGTWEEAGAFIRALVG